MALDIDCGTTMATTMFNTTLATTIFETSFATLMVTTMFEIDVAITSSNTNLRTNLPKMLNTAITYAIPMVYQHIQNKCHK